MAMPWESDPIVQPAQPPPGQTDQYGNPVVLGGSSSRDPTTGKLKIVFQPESIAPEKGAASPAPWEDDPIVQPASSVGGSAVRGALNSVAFGAAPDLTGVAAAAPQGVHDTIGQVPVLGRAADFIAGGVNLLAGGEGASDRYKQARDEYAAQLETDQAQHPVASAAGGFLGAIATAPLFAPLGAAKGVGVLARVAGGIRQGAAGGALYGAGSANGGDLGQRLEGALIGGGTGAALGGALGTVGRKASAPGTAGRDVLDAAERQGISIPKVVGSDSAIVQHGGTVVGNVPLAGAAIGRAAQNASDQVGAGFQRVAGEYAGGGVAANPAAAGQTAREGMTRYVKTETATRASRLYNRVDKLVSPNYTTNPLKTAQAALAINARRQAAATGPSKAVGLVDEAINRKGGLTYKGIKDLRTTIGEMVDTGVLPADISGGELKQLYGALTEDLQSAVKRGGGTKALTAWETANAYAADIAKQRKDLAGLLKIPNEEGIVDRLVAMAGSKGRADGSLLRQARRAMAPDEWDQIASAAISRLGMTPTGFSPLIFLRDYGNLSAAGKDVLFRSTGHPGLAAALDDLATISTRFGQLQKLANTSKTAFSMIGFAMVGQALANPVQFVATGLGATVMAHILASPASVRSLTRWSIVYSALIKSPTKAALASFKAESRRFAADLGDQLGLKAYVAQMADALTGGQTSNAEDSQTQH